jgi:hypothetical protein
MLLHESSWLHGMNKTDDFLVRVIEDYQAPYPDPIQVKMGEEVNVDPGKRTEIAGWIWCTNRAGKDGWVPRKYIEIEGNQGRMLQDYNAIELTIHVDDVLVVQKTESGFYWVRNQAGVQGWVPIANVEAMESEL